jgi:hypothetical protein
MLSSPSSFLPAPLGGYYACNKYLKGVAEGTLEGEAKSAHAAEAANLAWQKEGREYHHLTAEIAVRYSVVVHDVALTARCILQPHYCTEQHHSSSTP